ncbi:MAG: N-acetylmuramoyl-L-alanine amidase [Firmicutes bacterium]|nr:N-acetylmuramoyl-L-alanine amidase [Bacillota bacterium]
MLNIEERQIVYNISKRTQKPIYIVIHDTGNKGAGANADAHFSYFNSGSRNASADFFVDDKKILKVNDYNKYYTYHCGDGKGKYGITNSNSVGIEICVNKDGDYNVAFQNAVRITMQLMTELAIPIERVVRHYDASHKNCPASMSANSWQLWKEFKSQIMEGVKTMEELKKEIASIKKDIQDIKKPRIYDYVDDNMPLWAKPTVVKLKNKGYLHGDEEGKLNLDENILRMLVINDRAGIYGE